MSSGTQCEEDDRKTLSLPTRYGGLGISNPCSDAKYEFSSSVNVTASLVEKIISQSHELPDETEVKTAKQKSHTEKEKVSKDTFESLKESLPEVTVRSLELAAEKGASTWLTVIPLKEMGFDLNRKEFRDALRLR
ncbi:hypothetical protein AC249_AIPGENE16225 [Exaiptasia diaphana]|nr:hypothetical protein AC249_AIPGENE16225 [Exaiptasia diaphana]